MRKFALLSLAIALFLGLTKAAACGDTCSSSSDCAAAGDCRLCISGTCQHRCEDGEEEFNPECVTPIAPVAAAQCGDTCSTSSDCANAGDCRICISGTCQHRCYYPTGEPDVNFLGAACGDACTSSSDCNGSPDCRLCISGTCQHRCEGDEEEFKPEPVTPVTPVAAAQCGDTCSTSSDCANAGDCRLCISGTCQHRCDGYPTGEPEFITGAAQCGDTCSSSADCSSAGDCRICISGTCQHRC